jgi:ribosomal protein S18 acetylase RimI-like enzyme
MNVRSARIEDARAIAQAHVLSWQRAYGNLLPREFLASLSVEQREGMWHEAIASGQPSVLVAESSNQVIGFSAFGPCRDEGASPSDHELWAIYVSPNHWSTGVGRALWLRTLETMAARGATRVSLWVIAGNERAISFYTAAGFILEAGSAKPFEVGGTQLHEARFVLHGGA